MNIKPTIIITSLVLTTLSGLAFSQSRPSAETSTEQLVTICKAPKTDSEKFYCNGFGQGVWETYLITRHPVKAPPFVCLPDKGLSRDQILSDFYEWVNDHPQFLKNAASDTILRFMGTKFPCKN